MKVLMAGFRDPNHSSAGGYDPISKYPGAKYYNGTYIPHIVKPNFIEKIFIHIALRFFYLRVRTLRHKYDIIHCFYGDSAIFPFYKSKKHKIVITVHLDLKRRRKAPKKFIKLLQNANGVIVLSTEQARIFKEQYNINAKFIPHGFNLPKFNFKLPKDSQNLLDNKERINVFLSGKQYRDSETIIQIVSNIHKINPKVLFHAFGQSEEVIGALNDCENVILYPRVSDDEYYSVLSKCDYNFLPVTFATANNTLLEGEFLGIEGIFPQISGIEDYAAPFPMNQFYQNFDSLKMIFSNLKKQKVTNKELIYYSQRFLWKNIYPELEKYYNSL